MVIKKYLRRENGIIYKYARVTYRFTPEKRKMLKSELEDYQLMEGYHYKGKLQEIYRREFRDFSLDLQESES